MNTFIVLTVPKLETFNPLNWDLSNLNPTNWTVLKDIANGLNVLGEFLNYLLHPTRILWLVWNWTIGVSYFVCLCLCTFAILSYIFGYKKWARLAPGSILGYTALKIVDYALKSTF